MGKYIKNKVSNFIYGHGFKSLAKQTNEKVHFSSVNLEEKVQKVTNLLIHVSNNCLRMVKIKKKKSKNHEYFDLIVKIRGKNCKGWQICWKRVR